MRQAPGVPMPVLVDDLAARRLQRIELQRQGLIVCRDAGVADVVHAEIMRGRFCAIQPFLAQGLTGEDWTARKGSVVRAQDVVPVA